MQKKLPYILAIVLPFLVVWPLSVILLPQAQTKLHLWVIGIALFIVIFFAVWRGNYSKRCKRAWRLLSVAVIASALLFWAIDTTNSTLVPDLRFHLFEQQHQAEAERISTALSEVPDQYFQELEGEETSHLLALDGVLYLDKSQSRPLLFFNTQLSSFSFYGYLYCPEHKQLQEDYDFVHWINNDWAWVKVY